MAFPHANAISAAQIIPTILAAAALGALGALAWAPWFQPWILLPVLGLLHCLLIRMPRPLAAALPALAFAISLHAAGEGWAIAALFRETGLLPAQALLTAAATLLYLAAFIALPVYLCARWRPARRLALPDGMSAACLAAALTAGEWARGVLPGAFGSLSMGYAWLDTPLDGLLPIVGLYGLGFVAWLLCLGWLPAAAALARRRYRPVAIAALALGSVIGAARWSAGESWAIPHGDPLSFRLIHTATAQQDKFMPEQAAARIASLMEQLVEQPAQIVLTPETAFPVFFHQLPAGLIERLLKAGRTDGSHFFIGIALMGDKQHAHNSLLHIPPGMPLHYFAKELLMPLGEYSPQGLAWLSQRLAFPLKDLSPGRSGQQAFLVDQRRAAALICHEDSTPGPARRRAADASLLLNPSNLAWFGESAAIPQGLVMARARALETGRPVLRTANAGGAAHIDHLGRIVAQAPPGAEAVLSGEVQPMRGLTPYARFGDAPVLLACAALVLLSAARRWRAVSRTSLKSQRS